MTNTETSIQTWKYDAGSGVAAVALSGDGETVVAVTLGKKVLCLDGNGRQRWGAKVGNQAWCVGLSADGQTTVVGTGSTRPWDMGGRGLFCFANDGSLLWQVDLKASVWGLALSADAETIAVGTDAKQLILFDGHGSRLWHQDVRGLGWYAWVWSAAVSADGGIIVAGAADKRVRLFERSGVLLGEHQARADVFTVAVSAEGEAVAAGDTEGYVYWLNQQGHLLWEEKLADKVWAVILSADSERLLVGAGEKESHLRAYDQAGHLLWRRHVEGSVSSLALGAGGQRAAAGTRDGAIHVFDAEGDVLHEAQANKLVRQVTISATGEHVVAGSEDGYVYGFQLPTPPSASTPVAQEERRPEAAGSVYSVYIEQATGLAIGDRAQVVQAGGEKDEADDGVEGKVRLTADRQQRCDDLAENIRETLELIKGYEDQRRLAEDLKAKRRAEREIADLRRQLVKYEAEARQLGCDASPYTEKTLLLLTDSSEKIPDADNRTERLLRRLPVPTYSRLFGIESQVDKLLRFLRDQQEHYIISIQGIGGIGKTAVADHTARRFIPQADTLADLIWISAKQEYLTESGIVQGKSQANLEGLFDGLGQKLGLTTVLRLPLSQKVESLAPLLRAEPYLVIIDNLETVQDFERLVPWLEELAAPTKFLLTSREDIPSLTTVTRVRLKELDKDASLALIHHAAQEKQVDDLDVQSIYNLVGGNPLAIILIVSQMRYLPPATVLESVRLGTADEIYRYVYWKSWSALTNEAREILFTIQRAGDQADWHWLTTMIGQSPRGLHEGLQRLIDLSLVQLQRSPDGERHYTIHRLTSTFLRIEVLGWK